MIRPIALMLLLLPPLSGCGEAERPRFVPAAGDAVAAPPADRRPAGGAARSGAIPKNIPMH